MTSHGLATIGAGKKSGEWEKATAPSKPPLMPADLRRALKDDGLAWKNFQALAKSYQTTYLYWILTAKRKETRRGRIQQVVDRSRLNLRPGEVRP